MSCKTSAILEADSSAPFQIQVVSQVTVNTWNVLGHVLELTEILRHGLSRVLMKSAGRKTLAFAPRGSVRSFRPQSYSGHSCAHEELTTEIAEIHVWS